MFSPKSATATGKPPRKATRSLTALGVTLAAGVALAGLTAPAALAAPAGNDGGVDMNAACASQYSNASTPTVGVYATGSVSIVAGTTGQSVYDWSCFFANSNGALIDQLGGVNVNEQCAAQYGQGAVAQFTNEGDPDSWYCFTP